MSRPWLTAPRSFQYAWIGSQKSLWQYTNGVRDTEVISPDNWHVTQRLLDRPGNEAI